MVFIFTMSTEIGSAAHTSRVIEPVLQWFKPSASAADIDLAHFLVRKMAHLTEYAILASLVFRALRVTAPQRFVRRPGRRWAPALALAIALGISATYAATDEFHQSFVPGRESCVRDVLIDSSGALGGLVLLSSGTLLVRSRRPNLAR
jgi:VanZ family protein